MLQVVAKSGQSRRAKLTPQAVPILTDEHVDTYWDAIVIGSGVGGLTTATEMARKGAKVLVLESYIIPGGSAGVCLSCCQNCLSHVSHPCLSHVCNSHAL